MPTTTDRGKMVSDVSTLEERDVRALEQYLTVLPARLADRPRGPGEFLVVSQSGESYLVDADRGRCECADHEYRDVRCKHVRRVAFATGRRPIPPAIDRDDVDPDLGIHVEGPRFLAADGGRLVDGKDEVITLGNVYGDADPEAGDRPGRCECTGDDHGLPCWACYLAGHETPNPDAPVDVDDVQEDGD